MGKTVLVTVITFVFFALRAAEIDASFLAVTKDGKIVWKVLSEEAIALDVPKHSYIEVKKAAEVTPSSLSKIILRKNDDKVSLVVSSDDGTKELDVSNWQDDLIEIEERAEVQKLVIGVKDDKFTLKQKGVSAQTTFPLSIDSDSAQLSVLTESGSKFISILPYQAVESALRSKLINKVGGEIEVFEENRELKYKVAGEKVFNFFRTFDYSIPVTLSVSASTGEILDLNAPGWFRYISFLFT